MISKMIETHKIPQSFHPVVISLNDQPCRIVRIRRQRPRKLHFARRPEIVWLPLSGPTASSTCPSMDFPQARAETNRYPFRRLGVLVKAGVARRYSESGG